MTAITTLAAIDPPLVNNSVNKNLSVKNAGLFKGHHATGVTNGVRIG